MKKNFGKISQEICSDQKIEKLLAFVKDLGAEGKNGFIALAAREILRELREEK